MENTFGIDIIPGNDLQRIEALRRYKILDTPPEGAFDNVAKLATQIFKVPISLISLVDAEQVFFKANIGMGKAKVTSRGVSLCSLAVLKQEVTVFEDAPKEPCLLVNPNVAGSFGLKFYAGAPLTTHDGFRIGTLCVIDKTPRKFTKEDKTILEGLAKIVMDEIELRLAAITETDKLQQSNEELKAINEEMTDINQQMTDTYENLQVSEQKFRNLVSQAPLAITTYSGPHLIIDQANEAILKLLGLDESIIGQPLLKARPELLGHPYLDVIIGVLNSGITHVGSGIKAPVRFDGVVTEGYFDVTYKPVKDGDGKVAGVMVVAADVTEKTLARQREVELNEELASINEALLASNEELSVLAEQLSYVSNAIPQQVWTATPDGLLDFVNEQTIQYFGKDACDIVGEKWIKLVHPDDLDAAGKAWAHALTTGEPYQTEFRLLSKSGAYVWHLARATSFSESGKIIKWFGTNTDIDGHKQLEQHKTDFISIASHELKTPITSLKASLQLLNRLKDQAPSVMLSKLIEQSNRGVQKISSLVDDLLSVSRINEGQVHLKKTNFVIAEMLQNCFGHVIAEGKFEVIIEGDNKLQIFADEHLIEQVVVNLVNNAVKYAPDSKQIRLSMSSLDNEIKIAVIDTGKGISPDKLPHLFDRYYRADHSGQQYSGLGLGLYICSEIIKRHQGNIGVKSELGKGSEFWFTVPVA